MTFEGVLVADDPLVGESNIIACRRLLPAPIVMGACASSGTWPSGNRRDVVEGIEGSAKKSKVVDEGKSCVIGVHPSPLILDDGAEDRTDFCLAPDARSWGAELPTRIIREGRPDGGGEGDDGCCRCRWERVDVTCDTGELGVGSEDVEFDIVLELGLGTGLVSAVLLVVDAGAAALGPGFALACFAASFSSSSSSSSSSPLIASNLASVKSITLPMVMPPPSTVDEGPASDSSENPSVEEAETPCWIKFSMS